MMTAGRSRIFCFSFLALVVCAFTARSTELQVFAAASLTDVLREIAPAYESASENKLQFNFAGSNILARQIQEGAPADVFLSADGAKMDALEKAGVISADTREDLLTNRLVVVVAADSSIKIESAQALAQPAIKRLALADPKGVPAGIYARQYLDKAGLWPSVKDRVVPTENVRAALAAVEAGNADAGIVYKTDAGMSKLVKVTYEVPSGDGPPISYPIALVTASKNPEPAKGFIAYLKSEAALTVFRKFGFGAIP